jgi:hypothetical protein
MTPKTIEIPISQLSDTLSLRYNNRPIAPSG